MLFRSDMVIELLALGENFRIVEKPRCGPWACPALLRWSSEKGERVRVLIILSTSAGCTARCRPSSLAASLLPSSPTPHTGGCVTLLPYSSFPPEIPGFFATIYGNPLLRVCFRARRFPRHMLLSASGASSSDNLNSFSTPPQNAIIELHLSLGVIGGRDAE